MTWKDMYVEIAHTHAGASDSVSVANRRWLDDQPKPAELVRRAPWFEVDEALAQQRPVFVEIEGGSWFVRRDVYFNAEASEALLATLAETAAAACRALLEALEALDGECVIDDAYFDEVVREREAEATATWLDDVLAGRWHNSGRRVFACPDHIREALQEADTETREAVKEALAEAIQPFLGNDIDFADDFTFLVAETIRVWRVVRRTVAAALGVAPVSLIDDSTGRSEEVENAYTHWLYVYTKRINLLGLTPRRYDLLRNSNDDLETLAFLLDGTSADLRLPDDWKTLGLYGGGH